MRKTKSFMKEKYFLMNQQNNKFRLKTYRAWISMRARCNNFNHEYYHRYGGRGISVCKRWNDFNLFLKDLGLPPFLGRKSSLERIDNDGDYKPSNCKWATQKEQCRNRSTNRDITFKGRVQSIAEWAEEIGISRKLIRDRLEANWSISKIFSTSVNHHYHIVEYNGETKTISEWAKYLNIDRKTLRYRLQKWPRNKVFIKKEECL